MELEARAGRISVLNPQPSILFCIQFPNSDVIFPKYSGINLKHSGMILKKRPSNGVNEKLGGAGYEGSLHARRFAWYYNALAGLLSHAA